MSRLRQRGLVLTSPDPHDGRRTRIRVADDTLHAISRRAARTIDTAIAHAVTDPTRARHATALLEELANLLL